MKKTEDEPKSTNLSLRPQLESTKIADEFAADQVNRFVRHSMVFN